MATPTTTAARTRTVGELIESIWAASALVTSIGAPALAADDAAAPVLARFGLVEWVDGGWVPSELLRAEIPPERTDVVRERLGSALGQAAGIAAVGTGQGWDSYSDEVFLSQGRLSAAVTRRGLSSTSIRSAPNLAEVLDGCRVFLNVGVGVAGAACAICDVLPHARVIGLDVNPRALALARELVAARGLTDRVELRLQGVEELQDVGVASLAQIPPQFIPRPAFVEGVTRLFRALEPGGLLIIDVLSDAVDDAIDRWQAHNAGGTPITLAECAEIVMEAGFEEPKLPPELPAGAAVAYCRRP